jgi:hypothetical protein
VVTTLLSFALAGCADEGFTAKFAPGFSEAKPNVSVFAVFKNGRLSADAWDQVGPNLSPAFSASSCETAYNDQLLSTAPALAEALDDYTRANGVTDALINELAPMAKGDTIAVFTIAGEPPQAAGDAGAAPSKSTSPPPAMRGGGRRGRGAGIPMSTDEHAGRHRDLFEVSVTYFSIRLHRSVGYVSMEYSGSSAEEALKKFADKLRIEMPGASCAGWSRDVHIDVERIRSE